MDGRDARDGQAAARFAHGLRPAVALDRLKLTKTGASRTACSVQRTSARGGLSSDRRGGARSHSDIRPERCVAGESFKAGVSITTADDGTGAIRVAAELWRNLCRNLIVIDRARQTTSVRHVGEGLAGTVRRGIEVALRRIESFSGKWTEASLEDVLERYQLTDVEKVFRALVVNRIVHVPGVGSDEMVERLQRAWAEEPGYSKTAIVNAVSRAAHTETWRSFGATEELERTAGELLYARVWNVQVSEEMR